MYKSLRHFEISINNCNEDLNANPTFFEDHYGDVFDFFSKMGLSKDTYIQICNLEVIRITTSSPSPQVRKILDKILGEYLPPMNPRNIYHFEVSSSAPSGRGGCQLISDKVAQNFFTETLRYQRGLKEISVANAGLASASTLAILKEVILIASESEGTSAPSGQRVSLTGSMQGCYNTLQVLDLSGNSLDDSARSCQSFLQLFDFLSCLQKLNIERLKFKSFKVFKNEFLVPFCPNDDYKPYQNTLRHLNLNIGDPSFYNLRPKQMSYPTSKKIVDNIVDNFSYLDTIKLDFLSNFVMKADNLLKL